LPEVSTAGVAETSFCVVKAHISSSEPALPAFSVVSSDAHRLLFKSKPAKGHPVAV
jgi:hypothetical protein